MQRRKIPQSVFFGLAIVLVSLIYLIEHYLKPRLPDWSLALDLSSKACLSMFTGSIFFLVTETFKNRKAKEKAADVQREFLSEIRKEFNSFIQGFKTESVPGEFEPDQDYFGTSTAQELVDFIRHWREIKTLTIAQTQEGAFGWIATFMEVATEHESLANHYRASFTVEFNKKLDSTMREFRRDIRWADTKDLPWKYRISSGIRALIIFRDGMVALENIYRKEHNLQPMIDPSNGMAKNFDWPGDDSHV